MFSIFSGGSSCHYHLSCHHSSLSSISTSSTSSFSTSSSSSSFSSSSSEKKFSPHELLLQLTKAAQDRHQTAAAKVGEVALPMLKLTDRGANIQTKENLFGLFGLFIAQNRRFHGEDARFQKVRHLSVLTRLFSNKSDKL